MQHIENCPLCGREAHVEDDVDSDLFNLGCQECDLWMVGGQQDKAEMISRWNKRPCPTPVIDEKVHICPIETDGMDPTRKYYFVLDKDVIIQTRGEKGSTARIIIGGNPFPILDMPDAILEMLAVDLFIAIRKKLTK
jgi:hypothetical protein